MQSLYQSVIGKKMSDSSEVVWCFFLLVEYYIFEVRQQVRQVVCVFLIRLEV